MAIDQTDKLGSIPSATGTGDTTVLPPRRPRTAIWPADTGQSEDTFATPSEPLADDVDPDSLIGPEPAVFGGVNPESTTGEGTPAADGSAPNADQIAAGEPLGTPLDESVRGNELLGDAPKINYARIARSAWFLLASMVFMLLAARYFIRMAIPTQTYVQASVHFNNYTKLNELEVQDLQIEMNKLLRTYPLRAQAWKLLKTRSPDVQPGFLNSGLTFHRLDAIAWESDGTVRLRVDSEEPENDITRLSAITDAFYAQLQNDSKKLDEYRRSLKQQQDLKAKLLADDAELKMRADELLSDAQRYMDLKQAMQAMERYLELADESNPLRLVARQNLTRLTRQVADARRLSLERDDLLGQRVNLQKQTDSAAAETARLERAIDVFPYPDAPDPHKLSIYDTRPHQKLVMHSTWIAIVCCFGGLIAIMHLIDHREAERLRRQRRELLKAQIDRAATHE